MLLKRLALLFPTLIASVALAAGTPVGVVPESLEVHVAVKATMHSFTARVTGGELAITTDAAGAIDSATFTFDWSGVKTDNDKRDREMLEWVRAEEHPKGTFTLKAIEAGTEGTFASGTLELHGNSREIEFPVMIEPAGAGFRVSGEATLDHREWGLKQIKKFGMFSVNPTVTIRFKFETTGPA
ncbi:MAG TPA: YceI family protein [Opitutaceae bacterium]|nr:YceI family protein [Opitutaceae bacterium]